MENDKKSKKYIDLFFNNKLFRNIVVVLIAGIVFLLVMITDISFMPKEKRMSQVAGEETGRITEEAAQILNEAEDPTVDTANWKNYENQWYGFEIKYPESWEKPVSKKAGTNDHWEYRYQFRNSDIKDGQPYIGFDLVVYGIKKVKELSGTDEFPTLKSEELKDQEHCQAIEGHLGENEEYPAEQIYISLDDDCYHSAFFYTLTRDDYIYNFIPVTADMKEQNLWTEKEILQNFPEFVSAAATIGLIDIKRPKPVPIKPKITAPHPAAATKKDKYGRLVCAKKNDKPGKSKQGKKKHLDMECCLDPDEYPNPWCYYPPDIYGHLLDKL